MTINCNVTGGERKRLAQALGAILLCEPVYQGAPSFGYAVGDYTVDRNGTISCPDSVTPETVAEIIAKLTNEGLASEIFGDDTPAENPAETPDVAPEAEAEAMPDPEATEATMGAETPETVEETAEESQPMDIPEMVEAESGPFAEASATENETKLTVNIPRDKLPDEALARLRIMVANKEVLFKRALLADTLPIEVSEDKVSFPWFTLTGAAGEAEAHAQFVTHLCKMVTEQTRVLDKPYDGDNDRFAMRIFMVRLGMKGAQFALARKLMMQNLTGNSGWRYGAPPKKAEETPIIPTEEPEAPTPEEVSEATVEDIPADSESVPNEVAPAPAEAAPVEKAADDDVAAEGD